ncbi:3'(2'),5'-bisphosphate nucleotidase CysQ [Leptospira kobayashii]|uniref:3'(2'),5'-bisphosphate nucleotidase CysQ n=1 Tax=Leptospira kobayashii TaxID=1917830 RepID=A0ABN6KG80_9LEPT|nr:3'(2'),5'-bisphosphate nucleotidase CysQ [Leptospira kobayashii]
MLMDKKEFEEVWKWVLYAGDKILSIYQTDFLVKDKGGNDPVTEADLLANDILYEQISKNFPDHGFLSEERKDDSERLDKEWVWILDPIDGTREFVKKNGQFALSLGLAKNGEPYWGVIFNPATGEFFSKDEASFSVKLSAPFLSSKNIQLIESELSKPAREEGNFFASSTKPKLFVSLSEMKEGLFSEDTWKENFEVIPLGSIAYKLGLLSAGVGDLIVSLKPKNEWDICGGISLLSSRAFRFFPLKNEESYSFNNKDTRSYGLVAGTKNAVDYLLDKIPVESLTSKVRDKW